MLTANVLQLAEVADKGSLNFRLNTDFASTKPTSNLAQNPPFLQTAVSRSLFNDFVVQ
jgi:hypothetical protein